MPLPILFALIGIIGGAYGVYQYLNKPRCPTCQSYLKIENGICSCPKGCHIPGTA